MRTSRRILIGVGAAATAGVLALVITGGIQMRRAERIDRWLAAHAGEYDDLCRWVMPSTHQMAVFGEVANAEARTNLERAIHAEVGDWVRFKVHVKGGHDSVLDIPAAEYLRRLDEEEKRNSSTASRTGQGR